jgi:tRNA threonylcarbamoyl adenosine modification protein (Sua5/YciO/YrdC/YwlC family)
MLLTIDTENPPRKVIRRALDILRQGGVIAYPTDTVYGIGCDIFDKKAIERIYQIKRIHKHKPLSFICSDLKDISQYAQVSNSAYRIMKRLLPGPYTFVLQATRLVPRIMLTNRKTVGIRVPDNEICREMVSQFGHPIISTSASFSDEEVLSDPYEIEKNFGHALDLIIDGGILKSEPSSIVSLIEDPPVVIRAGKGDVSIFE